MANPKDLGSREVLLTDDGWRIVRVSWRDIEGTTAPYMEHRCYDGDWMWFLRNNRDMSLTLSCGHCHLSPPDGMIVALRFLRYNED